MQLDIIPYAAIHCKHSQLPRLENIERTYPGKGTAMRLYQKIGRVLPLQGRAFARSKR